MTIVYRHPIIGRLQYYEEDSFEAENPLILEVAMRYIRPKPKLYMIKTKKIKKGGRKRRIKRNE